jgi:hypothetical protein
LTRSFAVISVVAMAVLGLALVAVTWSVMSQQSVRDGIATAQTVTAYANATVPTDSYLAPDVLTPEQKAVVDGATAGFGERLVELRLWALDGSLIYSSDEAATTGFPDGARLDLVTQPDGQPSARVIT